MRILTNRKFPDGKSFEWIEFVNGGFLWKGEDHSMKGPIVRFGFPVDAEFVADKFRECGREFDKQLLPGGSV